jgi:hypothetical protein
VLFTSIDSSVLRWNGLRSSIRFSLPPVSLFIIRRNSHEMTKRQFSQVRAQFGRVEGTALCGLTHITSPGFMTKSPNLTGVSKEEVT